jgi:hypothetical protein
MDNRDQRATELSRLKSDLADFGLRLDAFEARSKGPSVIAALRASTSTAPDLAFAKQIVFAMKKGPPPISTRQSAS